LDRLAFVGIAHLVSFALSISLSLSLSLYIYI